MMLESTPKHLKPSNRNFSTSEEAHQAVLVRVALLREKQKESVLARLWAQGVQAYSRGRKMITTGRGLNHYLY